MCRMRINLQILRTILPEVKPHFLGEARQRAQQKANNWYQDNKDLYGGYRAERSPSRQRVLYWR
jgi:hypothetical protein